MLNQKRGFHFESLGQPAYCYVRFLVHKKPKPTPEHAERVQVLMADSSGCCILATIVRCRDIPPPVNPISVRNTHSIDSIWNSQKGDTIFPTKIRV